MIGNIADSGMRSWTLLEANSISSDSMRKIHYFMPFNRSGPVMRMWDPSCQWWPIYHAITFQIYYTCPIDKEISSKIIHLGKKGHPYSCNQALNVSIWVEWPEFKYFFFNLYIRIILKTWPNDWIVHWTFHFLKVESCSALLSVLSKGWPNDWTTERPNDSTSLNNAEQGDQVAKQLNFSLNIPLIFVHWTLLSLLVRA